jgi:hypothetical protein
MLHCKSIECLASTPRVEAAMSKFRYRHPHFSSRIVMVAAMVVLLWDVILMMMQVSSAPW